MRIRKFDDFEILNEQIQKKLSKVINWVSNLIDQDDEPNIKTNPKKRKLQIIFVAGLDYRRNDWSLEEQTSALKKHLPNVNVKSFCSSGKCKRGNHFPKDASMTELQNNPNSIVVLFSNGTQFSTRASKLISDKQNLFILEPYPEAASTVRGAVRNGVPPSNLITGNTIGRGGGMLNGSDKTPSKYGHFQSLYYMSQVLKNKYGF